MIRVAVIGYGTMGQVHGQAWQQIPGVELAVVADPDLDRRAKAKRDYGLDAVSGIEDVLALHSVDLIDICVPTYLHEAVFKAALAADKHIFCEKPLARTAAEGEEMLRLAEGCGKKIGVGHVVRFFPAYRAMRDSVLAGEIGRGAVARTFRGGAQFPSGWHDWFADFDLSGGVILDLAIHDVDYLRWLFGDVERVYAKSTYGRTTAHLEWAMLILRFKNGLIAHVEGCWNNFPGEFYTTAELAGSDGLLSYDSRRTNPILKEGGGVNGEQPAVTVPESPSAKSPYLLQLEDMVAAIREDRPPLVGLADALGSLRVALAAVESAQTGQPVTIGGI